MSIDSKILSLRKNLRANSKTIIHNLIYNHIDLSPKQTQKFLCAFCGSANNLTKEHVIPRWVFGGSTTRFFTTNINGLDQTYNRTTVDACKFCNSDLLNSLERCIQNLFQNVDLNNDFFTIDELENIIRWLEIIDYKFQVLNITRKFIKHKQQTAYISLLAKLPLSVMRQERDYSPVKVIAEIRRSTKRITIKNKARRINSLVVFKTKNTDFHFFHHIDDFIFLELPKYNKAFFYFYNKKFENEAEAYKEAIQKIKMYA